MVIHHKKNNLLYKDIACLCHSLARLWVLFSVVLFLLGLGFVPSSVLGVSSILFSVFVHRAVVFDGSFLLRTWKGCYFSCMLLSGSFLGLLLSGSIVVGTLQGCLSLFLSGLSLGLLFYQVLFIVVLFILFFSMVPLFVLSASFSVLFHTFFYPALILNGFVLFHNLYGYFLLTVLFWVEATCVTACDMVIESLVNRW